MKRATFIDGTLNGKTLYIDDVSEWSVVELESFLPPLCKQTTYRELVPGYWYVVKTEIMEMGI